MMNAHERPAAVSPPDDIALVRQILAGERRAFEMLMRRHNRRLYRLARATLRDEAEAEDALQDAYLRAFRSLRQFRGDAALSTWLSRLVLNECLARIRRAARRRKVVPITSGFHDAIDIDNMTSDAEGPDASAARSEMRAMIERKLDDLPDDFRVVFVLRAVEEMSVEEVARCLGVPEATVRSRHFRARALLREALAREMDMAERDVYEFGGWRCDRIVNAVRWRLNGGPDASSPAPV